MSIRVRIVAFLLAFGVSGCGGGSTVPHSDPTDAPVTDQANASNATRGTLSVALAEADAALFYARYLRPGRAPSLQTVAQVQGTPVCDPSTQTASTTIVDTQTAKNFTVVTAFYPTGDTSCAQSPLAVSNVVYPNAALPKSGAPQVGSGYILHFAGANDPLKSAVGSLIAAEEVNVTSYSLTDGSANVDLTLQPLPASEDFGELQAPPAGNFPASFPVALPLASVRPQAFLGPTIYIAAQETSPTASTTGVAVDGYYAQRAYGAAAVLNVSVSSNGSSSNLMAAETSAAYFQDPRTIALSTTGSSAPYPLPASDVRWTFQPPSAQGVADESFSSSQDALTASYNADGTVSALHIVSVDNANGIRCTLDSAGSAGLQLHVTDLRSQASAISPSTVVLDRDGNSAPYSYVLDGTPGLITSFTVLQ